MLNISIHNGQVGIRLNDCRSVPDRTPSRCGQKNSQNIKARNFEPRKFGSATQQNISRCAPKNTGCNSSRGIDRNGSGLLEPCKGNGAKDIDSLKEKLLNALFAKLFGNSKGCGSSRGGGHNFGIQRSCGNLRFG